jgi:23S rRNA (adenine2030-N6)-methyltransferase
MNYRHGYHAGNFADVVKHIALIAILQHLKKKDAAFSVVDSHAGRGLYDLSAAEAGKTGEAEAGIGRLWNLSGAMPEALAAYLALVKQKPGWYPGSPLIAAELLRSQDRLTAIEKHPEEFALLRQSLAPFRNAQAEQGDGYSRAIKLLPPPSRRGLALLDPPFESPDEFSALAQTVRDAWRKFATGIYLIWYPVKSTADAVAFTGEVLAGGMEKALDIQIAIDAVSGKLARAGLLVINPPYGFETAMRESATLIAPLLHAQISTLWLAGSE